MRLCLMSLFLLFFVHAAHADNNDYHEQAALWCSKLMHVEPDNEEKILLFNLLYWSWQHSATTLSFQKAIVEYVQASGSLMNGAMSARLNPARLSSILNQSTVEWEKEFDHFEHLHTIMQNELAAYRYAAATYAQCIEYILKIGDVRPAIKDLVKLVRENSRVERMRAWKEKFTSLSAIMENLKKMMHSLDGHLRDFATDVNRGFFEHIMEYANPAAFHAFASFDGNYNKFNAQLWNTLTSSYAMGNIVWEATEQVRVDFYKAHYDLLLRLLRGSTKEQDLFISAFDPEGFVEESRREKII